VARRAGEGEKSAALAVLAALAALADKSGAGLGFDHTPPLAADEAAALRGRRPLRGLVKRAAAQSARVRAAGDARMCGDVARARPVRWVSVERSAVRPGVGEANRGGTALVVGVQSKIVHVLLYCCCCCCCCCCWYC
jgi:hypothetical protein